MSIDASALRMPLTGKASFGLRFSFALSVLSFAFLVVQALRIAVGGELPLVLSLADDSFYYLGVAQGLAERGVPSFDGGQTITSGYHPLWCWILVALHWAGLDGVPLLRGFAALSSFVTLLGAGLLLQMAIRERSAVFLGVLAVAFTSYSFLTNQAAAMEWPVVFLISVLVFRELWSGQARLLYLLCVGIVGSLARTDFGGVGAAIFAAGLISYAVTRDPRRLLPGAALLSGAVLGLGLAFLWFYASSGQLLQGSALVKSLWGEFAGPRIQSAVFQFVRALVYLPQFSHETNRFVHANALWIVVVGGIFALVALVLMLRQFADFAAQARTRYRDLSLARREMLVAAVGIVSGYFLLYSINGVELQVWYTAHVTVPIIFLVSFLLSVPAGAVKWHDSVVIGLGGSPS